VALPSPSSKAGFSAIERVNSSMAGVIDEQDEQEDRGEW